MRKLLQISGFMGSVNCKLVAFESRFPLHKIKDLGAMRLGPFYLL